MLPFVAVAFATAEKMGIADKDGQGVVMRFCKIYPPEKIGYVIEVAQKFSWWRSNPKAAFMKAIGLVNAEEKQYGELWKTHN